MMILLTAIFRNKKCNITMHYYAIIHYDGLETTSTSPRQSESATVRGSLWGVLLHGLSLRNVAPLTSFSWSSTETFTGFQDKQKSFNHLRCQHALPLVNGNLLSRTSAPQPLGFSGWRQDKVRVVVFSAIRRFVIISRTTLTFLLMAMDSLLQGRETSTTNFMTITTSTSTTIILFLQTLYGVFFFGN